MNYLALCKRVRQEAGLAGDGPSAVTGQTGKLKRIVDWVNQAWVDIQTLRPDWQFMINEFDFNTQVAKRDYTGVDAGLADLNLWDINSFFMYDTTVGADDEQDLPFLLYPYWRDRYKARMDSRDDTRPVLFTILKNNSLRFEGRPDGIYRVRGEYKRATQFLVADGDDPTSLPTDYHMIIVWQAMKYYASYYNAPEVMDEAETGFDTLLYPLEREQLPMLDMNFRTLA